MGGTWTIPHLSVDKNGVAPFVSRCAWPFREFPCFDLFHAVIFVSMSEFFPFTNVLKRFRFGASWRHLIFECWVYNDCDGVWIRCNVCVWFHYHAPGSFMFGVAVVLSFRFAAHGAFVVGRLLCSSISPTWQLVQYLFQYMIRFQNPWSAKMPKVVQLCPCGEKPLKKQKPLKRAFIYVFSRIQV